MASDLQVITPKLIRSGMWSARDNLCRHRHLIVDADSVALHLFRYCVADHMRRQKSILSTNQMVDLYSASIVNYADYCRRIGQLFRFLADHHIEPVLVYSGLRNLESHLYSSPVASGTASSKQQVSYRLSALISYDKERTIDTQSINLPPLAMSLFKMTVNNNTNTNTNTAGRTRKMIETHQAYYSSFSLMTKLARDFGCPVLTNECDFLLMDTRAGFILFDELWLHHIELHNLATSQTAAATAANASESAQSRSRITQHHSSKTSSADASSSTRLSVRFYYNHLFLRQHPGLTAETCLYLFPLTSVDFVTTYASQLKKIRLYDSLYQRQDFLARPIAAATTTTTTTTTTDNSFALRRNSGIYQQYHKAAKRLELALNYVCGKEAIVLENLIKGDQTIGSRGTGFGADFRHLVAKYAVSYSFTQRLQFVLGKAGGVHFSANAAKQLGPYIQECLTRRECSANYLLELIYCCVGRLVCRSYNYSLAFEDLNCKRSANSIGQDRAKSMLMSLLNPPPLQPPTSGAGGALRSRVSVQKRSGLIRVDREGSKMAELLVDNVSDCGGAQLESLREPLRLAKLASTGGSSGTDQTNRLSAATKFINQAFMATGADMRQLPEKLEAQLNERFKLTKEIRLELAIVRSAFRFCLQKASSGDSYFKRTYSATKIGHDFELALVNYYICLNHHQNLTSSSSSSSALAGAKRKAVAGELGDLLALISKQDLENVAQPFTRETASIESRTSFTSGSGLSEQQSAKTSSSTATTKSSTKSSSTSKGSTSSAAAAAATANQSTSKLKLTTTTTTAKAKSTKSSRMIRHLIEMLNTALASYCELNAFFGYPMPKLQNLHRHYNPILLYNLCLQSEDKALIQFSSC